MGSVNRVIIPTPSALGKYNLTRFVNSNSFNGRQNNPFIKVSGKPGMEEGEYDEDFNFFMNEVILEAFEYQPVRITTSSNNGMVQAKLDYGNGGVPPIIASFRLLLDKDDVKITHGTHKWEDPPASLLNGLYNKTNEIGSQLAMAATAAANGAARVGSSAYKPQPLMKLDYQKVYAGTEPPMVEFTFTAFTNDNFIGDVYIPIMALAAFTYPQRIGGSGGGGGGSDSETNSWFQKALNTVASAAGYVAELSTEAVQQINETLSLSARQYSMKSPCLFNVMHQSGLYSYSNCMCVSMDITYEGPWYNAKSGEQQVFDILNSGPVKLDVSRRSFPTIAKVTMRFMTGERVMRDDFQYTMGSFFSILDKGDTTYTKYGNNS